MDKRDYQRRMRNGGKNSFDITKRFINENFSTSPYYQFILIENEEVEAIVNDERTMDEKTILLRPNNHIDKGQILYYEERPWLVMEINEDQIYPILKVRLCNQLLKSVTNGSEIPVVAVGKRTDLDEDKDYLIVTTNEISVYASYVQAKNIRVTEKFTMNERGYEVIGIDDVTEVYEGKGVIKFTVNVTELPPIVPTPPTPSPPTPPDTGGWGDWT